MIAVIRFLRRLLLALTAAVVAATTIAVLVWRDRLPVAKIDLPAPPRAERASDAVTVTWLGASTLLIADGETQLLVDPYLSRLPLRALLPRQGIQSHAPTINRIIEQFQIDKLNAILPSHSHFDNALDIGALANRTPAIVVGSPSSARIARGAGVPEGQLNVVTERTTRTFGNFIVTLLPLQHAPIGWFGNVPFEGTIDVALRQPATIDAFRVGSVFAIVVEHAQGTLLINPSAGVPEVPFENISADVAFLGVARLGALDRDYRQRYWNTMVTATGASVVMPLHFDDYTAPLGDTRLPPRLLDNTVQTIRQLGKLRDQWDQDARLLLPEFGETFTVFESVVRED